MRTLLIAVILAAAGPATAQPVTYRLLCTNSGTNWAEPVGDREAHSLQVGDATCVVQGGPMDGAVTTQQVIWEYDKGVGTLLSSQAVTRKPGAMAVGIGRAGKLTLQMTDGRVTGWSGNGTFTFAMATGGAASLDKKNASWTGRPTGNRTYVLEITTE
jgi:hypothetical protein